MPPRLAADVAAATAVRRLPLPGAGVHWLPPGCRLRSKHSRYATAGCSDHTHYMESVTKPSTPRLMAAALAPAVPRKHSQRPIPTAGPPAVAGRLCHWDLADCAAHARRYGCQRCAASAEAASAAPRCKLARYRHSLQDKASAVTVISYSIALIMVYILRHTCLAVGCSSPVRSMPAAAAAARTSAATVGSPSAGAAAAPSSACRGCRRTRAADDADADALRSFRHASAALAPAVLPSGSFVLANCESLGQSHIQTQFLAIVAYQCLPLCS